MEITSSMRVNVKKIDGAIIQLILWIAFFVFPVSLISQTNGDILDTPLDYQCQHKLISEILLDLSKLSQTSIAFDAGRFLEKRRSIDAHQMPFRKILKHALAETNSRFSLEAAGIVVQPEVIKQEYILSGFVEDNQSGERLLAATIYDPISGRGAITNEYGFFSLRLPEGERSINCSYLGYQVTTRTVTGKSSEQLTISLEPSLTLAAIEIVASEQADQQLLTFTNPSVQFGQQEIEELPGLGGEADIFRFLQSQPGVTTGTDGIGGLHVRGGSTDQNLILLDGVPIFNPSHSLGLFSIFNPATLKSATLHRSGYSAKYGGHLSSVLDIRTKEGNVKHFQSSLELSTVATKASVEIPFGDERGGIMLAARRTHLDPLIRSISRKNKLAEETEGEAKYFFYDLNAKLNYKIGNSDRLYLSFYKGEDKFSDVNSWSYHDVYYGVDEMVAYSSTQFLDWGNTISSLRWNHLYNDKLFSNATLTLSRFNYQSFFATKYEDDYYGQDYEENYHSRFYSNILDYRLNVEFDYYHNTQHHVLWGASGLRRNFEPGSFSGDFEILNDSLTDQNVDEYFEDLVSAEIFSTNEMNIFFEDRIQLNARHKISIGLHHAIFSNGGKIYQSLQPRLSYHWEVKSNLRLALSASRMTQFLHLLTAADAGLPNDLWVPSTERIRPQQAWEFALSANGQLQKGWAWGVSAYYKKMENVLAYAQDASLPGLSDNDPSFWEDEVVVGEGEAYGLETEVRWQRRKTQVNVNYTLSKSQRTFSNLNSGKTFPFRYDRPHNFNINLQHQFNSHWKLQAQWQYKTGIPITLFATEFPIFSLDGISADFASQRSTINGYRLPDYHRLDLNGSYTFGNETHQHQITFGAYNLYNRVNPIYSFLIENSIFPEENGLQQQAGLKMIPTIGYRWNWR